MNKPPMRLDDVQQDNLFPELEAFEDQDIAQDLLDDDLPPSREPVVLRVMGRLADLLGEETAAIRDGKFEAFTELQREKSILIRQVERLEHDPSALEAVETLEPEVLKARLHEFNGTISANMRAIGAVKDAVVQVREQALRKLEEEKGDGVYMRDGGKKSLDRISINDTKVKL
ncbi:MAG: hypothetical protein AAFR65_00850 [Pseudomonadota bacterium]